MEAASALPGWTAYYGNNQTSQIIHNTIFLGGVNISILDPNAQYLSIREGNYSVELQAGLDGLSYVPATLAQTSLIPVTTESILLKVRVGVLFGLSGLGLTLAGQNIALSPLASTSAYTLYGGDISDFAGLTEELSGLVQLRVDLVPDPS